MSSWPGLRNILNKINFTFDLGLRFDTSYLDGTIQEVAKLFFVVEIFEFFRKRSLTHFSNLSIKTFMKHYITNTSTTKMEQFDQ